MTRRTTLTFEHVTFNEPDVTQPDIEILGVVELSMQDLWDYEEPKPESQPICDLSSVVAEVAR